MSKKDFQNIATRIGGESGYESKKKNNHISNYKGNCVKDKKIYKEKAKEKFDKDFADMI